MTSRVAGLALIAAAVCGCGKSAEERAQEAKRAEADAYNAKLAYDQANAKAQAAFEAGRANVDAPSGPIERAPTYKPSVSLDHKPREVELADAAARAVYDVCSEYYVFREGSTIEATYVPPMGGRKTAMANVSVQLFDPAKASGNTLWYAVTFRGDGKLDTLAARKAISGQMCHLPEDESSVPFDHEQ